MLKYNGIVDGLKNFEPMDTSRWTAWFGGLNGGSKMNVTPYIAPIIDYNFSRTVETIDIPITPLGDALTTIKSVLPVKSISITMFEKNDGGIMGFLDSYVTSLPSYTHKRAISLETLQKYALELNFDWYNKQNGWLGTSTFFVIPNGDLPTSGNQDFALNTFPLDLLVVGVKQ
jgi:hypothetical protein